MPVRKDFLLDQLHEFFDVLQQIAARLMERNLDKAEEKINELWSAQTIARLTAEGDDPGLQQKNSPSFGFRPNFCYSRSSWSRPAAGTYRIIHDRLTPPMSATTRSAAPAIPSGLNTFKQTAPDS